MPQTKHPSIVTQYIIDLLKNKWQEIPLAQQDDVYWGEQGRYPRTPTIAVVPGTIDRELTQTGMQATITFPISILVMHGPLQHIEKTAKEVTEQAENVADILDADKTLGGLIIHGIVEEMEPGQVMRGELLSATRLAWSGFSKIHI